MPSASYCFVIAATILVSIASLTVNTTTIIAAVTKKRLDKPSYKFILGLAISDLMVGVFLPVDFSYQIFYEEHHVKDTYAKYFCMCFLPIFPLLFSSIASNVIQMIIAFDRCMSIIKPVLHRNCLTNRLAKRAVYVVFAFSIIVSSMPIYWNNFPNERYNICALLTFSLSYYSYVIAPAYVVNLVCLAFIYFQLNRFAAKKLTDNAKIMKMVAVILTCHAGCWLPHMVFTFFFLSDANANNQGNQIVEQKVYSNPEFYFIYHWVLLLAFSSSIWNALTYSWQMPEFRTAVNEIIFRKKTASSTEQTL